MKKYKEKVCIRCDTAFIPTGSRQYNCEPCGDIRQRRLVREGEHRRTYLRHRVTTEEFDRLFVLGCELCKRPFVDSPHVDHDHRCCSGRWGCEKCFRGLLCKFCNNGFVYAIESNPELRMFVSPEFLAYIDKL